MLPPHRTSVLFIPLSGQANAASELDRPAPAAGIWLQDSSGLQAVLELHRVWVRDHALRGGLGSCSQQALGPRRVTPHWRAVQPWGRRAQPVLAELSPHPHGCWAGSVAAAVWSGLTTDALGGLAVRSAPRPRGDPVICRAHLFPNSAHPVCLTRSPHTQGSCTSVADSAPDCGYHGPQAGSGAAQGDITARVPSWRVASGLGAGEETAQLPLAAPDLGQGCVQGEG